MNKPDEKETKKKLSYNINILPIVDLPDIKAKKRLLSKRSGSKISKNESKSDLSSMDNKLEKTESQLSLNINIKKKTLSRKSSHSKNHKNDNLSFNSKSDLSEDENNKLLFGLSKKKASFVSEANINTTNQELKGNSIKVHKSYDQQNPLRYEGIKTFEKAKTHELGQNLCFNQNSLNIKKKRLRSKTPIKKVP